MNEPEPPPGLLEELKRRKVVRAALVYGAGAFAVLQVADIVVEPLGLPSWTLTALIWLVIAGFAATLVISWFVDLSADTAGTRRWLSPPAVAAAGALVVIGVAAGWMIRPGTGAGPASDGTSAPFAMDPSVAVVLPFTVLGSEGSGYLSDAVARLLGASLDGTAGLRTVSAHALLGFPGLADAPAVTEGLAREVATHFGAGLWIVGDVVEAGDSLRIEATLVDRTRPGGDGQTVGVTAVADELFAAVDQLATLLVAEREAGTGSPRTRAAARTASSLDALRAYIEGERAFRSGSYLPAVEAFGRAVAADTAFALAFYRLSMAEERLAWAEASRVSAEAAYRHAQRLSPREREFLEAVVALRRGNTSEAEQMLRAHVRQHPDDPEAWYQLGEILFHGEPLRGGSMTAAREPLEKALYYDPGDLGALYHLVRIAVKDEDATRVDSLSERFVALSQGERTLELRALQAASAGDTTAFRGILSEMAASPDPFLPIAVWSVAVFGRDPAGAEAIARVMTGDDRPVEVRGAGHLMRAHLALAQGRVRDAASALDAAEALGDPDAAESRAWFAALPFAPLSGDEVRAARASLRAAVARGMADSPRPSSFFSAQNGVHPLVSAYLDGVLSARLDDPEGVRAALSRLRDVAGVQAALALASQLAAGAEAQASVRGGDAEGARRSLSELEIEGWYELTFVSPYHSGALERFTLAELLLAEGRDAEALAWYEGLRENNVAELVFAGPALLREAGIHRRAGRTAEAAALEARFEALWRDADPDFRARIREAYGARS